MSIEENARKRSIRTLHTLLIISFIYTGMWILCHFMLGFTGTDMRQTMLEVYQSMSEKNESFSAYAIFCEKLFAVPQWYYIICGLLDAISFAGLLLMWRIRKNGFHAYTLAKLMLMLMPLLFLDRSYVGFGDMMMAALFIAYYFVLMKNLGAFGNAPAKVDTPSEPEE
ncbi:MAG: hypothetical protein IJM33_05250 [Bacteroidales bacterium]|nr:hypothetical protein [Bacteroidales bacterium]MBR3411497.1 hypothetical protein [Bacteroidales bacterium]